MSLDSFNEGNRAGRLAFQRDDAARIMRAQQPQSFAPGGIYADEATLNAELDRRCGIARPAAEGDVVLSQVVTAGEVEVVPE